MHGHRPGSMPLARAQMYACTGYADRRPLSGAHAAVSFCGSRRTDPRILSAKDYLLSELTGARITEPSTAAGYGVYDLKERCFSKDLCAFWNFPFALLPSIQPANSVAGGLSEAGATLLGLRPGIPVSTGAADSVCAAYAMAGLDPRVVSVSFGSSAVIVGADERTAPRSVRALPGHAACGGPLVWTRNGFVGERHRLSLAERLIRLAGRADRQLRGRLRFPGRAACAFAPYLAGGEQGALWNPRLQGAIYGLNLRHSRSDLARAFLEGVFYEVRRCVDVLAETTPVESLRVSGNIVHSPSSTQMLADILDRVVVAVPDKSPAAIGAALLARSMPNGAVARWLAILVDAATTRPNRPAAQEYGALYREYVARAARCE